MIIPLTGSALLRELQNVGVHPASYQIFAERAEIRPLLVRKVRMPAANILKQELLSAGADCAVNESCVTGKVEYSDVVLLGSSKHYRELIRKLAPMAFFGLPKIAEALGYYLALASPKTVLADGRILNYEKMAVMGIINLTGNSFFPASRKSSLREVLAVAEQMLSDGAEILDLGAESSRPGALPVVGQEEVEKLVPVIKEIKKQFPGSIVSVDSYRVETVRQALAAGADIINDITGAADLEMIKLARQTQAPLIVMHMQGEPQTMQENPSYEDVVREVWDFFAQRLQLLAEYGVDKEKIIIDPGIGFGKKLPHNLELLQRITEFTGFGVPYLLAASRKSCIGEVLGGLPAEERLEGTLALSCQAVVAGAQLVRVHDVKENVRAIRMLEALRDG